MGFGAYHGEPGPGEEALGKVPRPAQPLVLSEVGSGGRNEVGAGRSGWRTGDRRPPQWRLRRPRLPMEQPLHRWEDRTQRFHSLKELRAGQRAGHPLCLLEKSFPAPLARPSAIVSRSLFPASWSAKNGLEPEPGFSGWSWRPMRFRAQAVLALTAWLSPTGPGHCHH